MAVKTKKIVNHASTLLWSVRDENGGVFGPVNFKTLKEWVEDGRVSPLSQVSSDEGANWSPAVSIAELEMNCVAEIEPGSFYGPIHQKAMDGLMNDGSVPPGAVLFRRSDSFESVDTENVSSAELQLALDKVAVLESENRVFEEDAQKHVADYEKLNAQVASLCLERDELRASSRKIMDDSGRLESLVEELRDNLNRIASERDTLAQRVESLQQEKSAIEEEKISVEQESARIMTENSDLKTRSDQLVGEYKIQIDALSEENQNLKSEESVLESELGGLRSEIDGLRKNLHEQQKLMDKQVSLHSAELKEKETSFTLRINNMALEHEAEIDSLRRDSFEASRSLQEEVGALQDEVRSLQRLNNVVSQEKESLGKRIQQLERKHERSHDESAVELEVKGRRIEELSSEIESLLGEIEELRITNEKLKTEFVAFEDHKTGEETARQARRKLIVLKQLFVEAAGLLQDVEDDADIEIDEDPVSVDSSCDNDTELLEFEEMDPHESHHSAKSAEKTDRKDIAASTDGPDKVEQSVPEVRKTKQSKSKTAKKWLFGSGGKNLDHRSLAELEAQARSELQRLSSQGGDISALFDKNK